MFTLKDNEEERQRLNKLYILQLVCATLNVEMMREKTKDTQCATTEKEESTLERNTLSEVMSKPPLAPTSCIIYFSHLYCVSTSFTQ